MVTIWINAGHSPEHLGAIHKGHNEAHLTIGLRGRLPAMLEDYEVEYVPDTLDLRKTIAWINERADINDLAFSIHFNTHNNSFVGGTEAYYSNDRERELAEIFSRNISKSLGIKNRGARHDSETWVGSLGWLRKLKCDSVLVEVCYLTNEVDMVAYDHHKAAWGFADAITELMPRKSPEIAEKEERDADLICLPRSKWSELLTSLKAIIKLIYTK